MSEKVLLVLYRSEKTGGTWAEYSSGIEEANREHALMSKADDTLEEVARIWIHKRAEIVHYNV